MLIRFKSDALRRMYTEADFTNGYSQELVRAYRKRIGFIVAAKDERDLYAWKGLRYEKLKGNRSHQRSIRLNDQFRLILEVDESTPQHTMAIIEIEDYH